jgi:hypothetical protein
VARQEFLELHPYCQWFIEFYGLDEETAIRQNGWVDSPPFCGIRARFDAYGKKMIRVPMATQIHHKRGRVGSLLTDQRYFMAVCNDGHHWIHTNTGASYERGFMLFR